MVKWMLAAGAAALAIASPSLAEKGGQGGGKDKGQVAKAEKGGGGKAARGQGSGKDKVHIAREHRGKPERFAQGGEVKQKGKVKFDDRGPGKAKAAWKDDDRRGRDDGLVRIDRKGDRDVRIVRINRDDDDFDFVPRWGVNGLARGFDDGCPPGLAKKNNGCLPPGQAKKLVGTPLAASLMNRTLGWPYRDWYRDNDEFLYRWDDDYIYRVRRDGGLIDALFPFANNDYYYYPVGAPYPDAFNYYNVPYQYRSFYPDGGDYWYRYGDGAIYMVDPRTQAISGIAALLTGMPLGIGQPLPPTYGVYNVPFAYRSQYYDTPDAMYRYNDGYIYRVDPTTMLITAVINALV